MPSNTSSLAQMKRTQFPRYINPHTLELRPPFPPPLERGIPHPPHSRSSLVPRHDPQRRRDAHAHHPDRTPHGRELAVVLQKDVDDIVRDARADVARAQPVEQPRRDARRQRRGHAARVEAQRLEVVGRRGLGALDAADDLAVEGQLMVQELAAWSCVQAGEAGGGGSGTG